MLPTVSILLPVYNEISFIDECLASLWAQDYQATIEVVVADGRSHDGTREHLEALDAVGRVVLVDNPDRNQAAGLNLAAEAATGEVLVRADGHTTYAPDYVARSVTALLNTTAVAVGGRQIPHSDRAVGAAVASAMASRWAVGPANYRHNEVPVETDTVYLGAYRRADFYRLGQYRHLPAGVAEDADLYYRWRKQGETVMLDPSIRSRYRPRDSWGGLARQFFRYGWGKADMLYLNRILPSVRPLAPLALVGGLTGGLLLGILTRTFWPLVGLLVLWAIALVSVAARTPGTVAHRLRTMAAAAIMQVGYGVGLAAGLLRGPGPAKRSSRQV